MVDVIFSFQELKTLYDKFRRYDKNKDQILSQKELLALVREEVENASDREVEWFLHMIDVDATNKDAISISFPQYVRGMTEFAKVGTVMILQSTKGTLAKTLTDSGIVNFDTLSSSTRQHSHSRVKRQGLNWKEIDRVYEQFQRVDSNSSGTISYSEMAVLLKKVLPELPESEYSAKFNQVDTNHSGFIDFMEFLQWVEESGLEVSLGKSKSNSRPPLTSSGSAHKPLQREKSSKALQQVKLRSRNYSLAQVQKPVVVDKQVRADAFKAFAAMDRDGDGELSEDEFKNALTIALGDISNSEKSRLYYIVDSDRSGEISYDEFLYAVAHENEVRKFAAKMQHSYYPSKFEWEIPFEELEFGPLIGEGNFGVVYKGKWHGTPVAIKKLKQQTLTDEIMDDFKKEVKILTKLRHPNVVLFMGACTQPNHLCIVMEYLPEGSVYSLLHKRNPPKKLSLDGIQQLSLQAARGMSYLHSQKVIHRDIKSLNLLLDDNHVCKLCDFGLSCLRPEKGAPVLTEQVGSPLWMAPELLANKPYGEKIDVYSFAVCIWECLTNSLPFKGYSFNELVTAVVHDHKRPDIPANCPPQFAALLRSCWEANPDKRPAFSDIIKTVESITIK